MKTITVSYSELYAARRCSLRHELQWVEGWQKDPKPDSPLAVGTLWHAILNKWYSTRDYMLAKTIRLQSPDEQVRDRLAWMFEGYIQTYGLEPGWNVLDVERPFKLELPAVEPGWIVTLKGKIDLIIQDPNGEVWVDDHKSCSALPDARNPIDDQLPLMVWAARCIGYQPLGARYSYSRTKPLKTRELALDERFSRRLINISNHQRVRAAVNAVRTAVTRYEESERIRRYHETYGPSLASEPPMSQRKECKWDCEFSAPCLAAARGLGLVEQLRSRGFDSWREQRKTPKRRTSEAQSGAVA